MTGPKRHPLPCQRWHFQHGPIDLVIAADGPPEAVAAAHEAAWARFASVLAELVAELPLLRSAVLPGTACALQGRVARRMWQACRPLAGEFITPMAAVAGAVAQELIGCYEHDSMRRAWVNNGGDIALHLAPGQATTLGVFSDLARFGTALAQRLGGGDTAEIGHIAVDGRIRLHSQDGIRGVATSGWRGRSHSLGIADSVTVLAATAAQADAAATIIANAVNVNHASILRRPACELRDDSDLGERLVTVDVPRLPEALRDAALAAGLGCAARLGGQGLIKAAVLVCQGRALQFAASLNPEAGVPELAWRRAA